MAMNTSNGESQDADVLPGIMRREGNASIYQGANIPRILPHEKVFPIQIGNELFRLSGASISSDAPSYFSAFFECQLREAEQKRRDGEEAPGIRTLYIDRDPVTFGDISRHLQGYHVVPRDGSHFVKLFADAQFYQLPRLVDQLYEEAIYISIGGREFRIHKDIFSGPGDSPNYFTLGYAFLFSSPGEVFPGLKRNGLLRPPSIMPPAIPNHSAAIFADLLHMLQGYPLHIRNEEHRKELLQDCKYFLFKGIEQKLIPHHISYNSSRMRDEIILRLEDLRQTGLSFVADESMMNHRTPAVAGWVNYARPHIDSSSYELIVEIGHEWMKLNTSTSRAELFGDGKKRIKRLIEIVAGKVILPLRQPPSPSLGDAAPEQDIFGGGSPNEDSLKFVFDQASITLDGKKFIRPADLAWEEDIGADESTLQIMDSSGQPSRKRRRTMMTSPNGDVIPMIWTVTTGQWRMKILSDPKSKTGVQCVLVAVKLNAVSGEQARNEQRPFLGG